jgi:hypothetical protein
MKFGLNLTLQILERTPITIQQLTGGLSDDWILSNEGLGIWSPFDIVGHLVHGEKMTGFRAHISSDIKEHPYHLKRSNGKTIHKGRRTLEGLPTGTSNNKM